MGHARNYTIGDAMARQARMRGFDVLHPIGFDAFGLPAENAAIKHNTQAAAWTYKNMDQALATMKRMGFSYDLDRMVKTCSPDYYRYDNVRITCRRYGVPLYDSLTALLDDLPQQSDE